MLRSLFAVGCTVAASALIAGSAAAQGGTLSGAVYDRDSRSNIAGAEVRIAGTNLVAITTADGRYTIADVPSGVQRVQIKRSGYRPFSLSEVRIGDAETTRVYFALAPVPAGDVHDEAVSIAAPDADPGPMYIIDGVIFVGGTLPPRIDPKDIETVEVIKGNAAREMYGESAGTGIIVITTRKVPAGRR